ncbi:DUF3237 domain-containing protein [Arthrobacter sp.]|uniref:DUF3237 domain-containing protein n=1 Tax=Arthrobacter sp. TaxID=1667 RepID=UPI003A93BA97
MTSNSNGPRVAVAPRLEFLATLRIEVAPAVEVGPTPEGARRIIPIVGGSVEGPELRGTVLPAGADFQILRSDTLTELQAEYAIETDDGQRIYVSNYGLRTGSAEDIARLVRQEPVDPERIYFRCTPRMRAQGKWGWLSSRILVGRGERAPGSVLLDFFVVE